MPSGELESERDYVSTLYARLDVLRDEAQSQLEAVRRSNPGGTHQNRSERDAFARISEDRIGQLRQIDERLAFGRLELESENGAPPVLRYIGRIGLRDQDLQPLLLDWRVPQARAFYQATAATPLGARARRHLQSQGREIVRIDDEIFDQELLTGDVSNLQGEAALLATLTAQRTGRMGDIVATIQAEQDAIIRSELRGTLVVQGGPGTGKTAVALHRAAYLLYSYRERLASSGVLIVGLSARRAFDDDYRGFLDLASGEPLTFERPDLQRFPALGLALAALAEGGAKPAILNAVNEMAVAAFLAGRIRFPGIAALVEAVCAQDFGAARAPQDVADLRSGQSARVPVLEQGADHGPGDAADPRRVRPGQPPERGVVRREVALLRCLDGSRQGVRQGGAGGRGRHEGHPRRPVASRE